MQIVITYYCIHIKVMRNIPVFRLINIVVTTTDKIFELFVKCYSSADTMQMYRTGYPKHNYTIITVEDSSSSSLLLV